LALAPTVIPYRDPMGMDEDAEEDDEPLATDGHYREQIYVYSVLYDRFAGPECYVAFQRWLRRDRERRLSSLQPDLLVALGVPNALRRVYNPWELGKPPTLVAEWLSDSSLKADRELKAGEYRKLGIAEYWLFNPYGEFRDPRVQGWDLQAEDDPAPLPGEADGSVASRVLPVRFVVHETRLAVLETTTGEPLTPLRAQELHILDEIARREREAALRHQAEQEAQREAAARRRAEEELARLRAELEQLRRERNGDA
jgi:Uma2 family endonuclease